MIKPILMNAEMVRAILDGRKTVTRRVVKPQPIFAKSVEHDPDGNSCRFACENRLGKWEYQVLPGYRPGDILWVRETFRVDYLSNIVGSGRVHYKADGSFGDLHFQPARYDMMRRAQLKPGWRPNANMPREAARIWLRVMDVRVERLQTEFFKQESAIFELRAEGIDIGETCRECISTYGRPCCIDEDPECGSECGMLDDVRDDFACLWDSTIKPADCDLYGWAANPWVWVIEFERCEKPANLNRRNP